MKFSSAFFAAALSLPLLTYALPAGELQARDGVTCTLKYSGRMIVEDANGNRRRVTFQTDNNGVTTLTVNRDVAAQNGVIWYYFDCFTSGWNRSPDQFGVVQPAALANQHQCITAGLNPANDGSRLLYVLPCAKEASARLDREWFYANYLFDAETSVRLTLNGNPNDNDNSLMLPAVRINSDETVSVMAQGSSRLYLKDTKILSQQVDSSLRTMTL